MKKSVFTQFLIAAAILGSALDPVMVKLAYRADMSFWQILCLRNSSAAAVIFFFACFRKSVWRLTFKNIHQILPQALLLLCANLCMISALKTVSSVIVVTVVATTPGVLAMIGKATKRVALGPQFRTGLFLAILGVFLSLMGDPADVFHWKSDKTGLLFLGAALCGSLAYRWRLDSLTQRVEPFAISFGIFPINAAVVLFLGGDSLRWDMNSYEVLLCLWLGLSAAMSNVAFVSASKILGVVRISVLDLIQRPLVVLLSAWFLSEPWHWVQGVGLGLVVLGVYFAKARRLVYT